MSLSAASKCPFLTRVPSTFLRNCGSSIGMYGQRCPVMSKLFHTAVGAARQGANRKPVTLGKHAFYMGYEINYAGKLNYFYFVSFLQRASIRWPILLLLAPLVESVLSELSSRPSPSIPHPSPPPPLLHLPPSLAKKRAKRLQVAVEVNASVSLMDCALKVCWSSFT